MSIVSKKIMMGSGAVALPSDDEFNRVSFLSHFEGSNNGVNNAFDDGSTNNHTITAAGNVTQGSFGPFARPDGEWGVSFDGTGDYLEIADDSSLELGSGNFTIECFFNVKQFDSLRTLASKYKTVDGYRSWRLVFQTNGTLGLDITGNSGGGGISNVKTATVFEKNTWYHLAVVRNSNTITFYINGTADSNTLSFSATPHDNSTPVRIGTQFNSSGARYYHDGFVSNFRIVVGTALYTGDFTAPTSKLTAVTNTKLLTCQSNRFVDNSASGHTLTPVGSPAVSAFGPFLTSSVYDPAVNGASAFFDGNGDYLSAPQIISQSGNFTIEGWVYTTSTDSSQVVCGGEAGSLRMVIESSGGNIKYFQDGVTTYTGSGKETLNQWCHFIAMRTGSNLAFYVNGTRVHNVSAANMYQGNFYIGNTAALSYYHYGYISNIRCTASAVYSEGTSITVPTAPYSTVTNTNLLLNMADGQAIDSAAQNNLTLYSNAKISSTQSKFGGTSMYFDGTYDEAKYFSNGFGTGDFTMEAWVYPQTQPKRFPAVYYVTNGSSNRVSVQFDHESNPNKFRCSVAGTVVLSPTGTNAEDQWYHTAVVRYQGVLTFYIDGTSVGSTAYTHNVGPETAFFGGNTPINAELNFKGFIDDFRVSNTARYTANFTPPTEPFADKGQ